jgi:EAL domain-containing protein (putative c-di-GMP-specific phosphodiesterase class I)
VGQLVDLARETLAVLSEPFHIGPHRLRVSASVGVVEQVAADTTPSEIVRAGDITLQWAKTDGRGRWALFDPARHARQTSQYRLAAAMPAAIENNEFALDYQPLVRLNDGSIQGVEALVRWRHPKLGLLGPEQFIGVAEDTGLIVPLGRWVMREASRRVIQWLRCRPEGNFFVSVNLAVRQAQEPDLADEVAAALAETGVKPDHLQLELTESAVMTTVGQPLENLRRLAAMGVRIAIDDFGTGYSNLAYLRTLPVHGLKLAGSFVKGLREPAPSGHTDEQIVDTLIRLAHAIGLVVTAEAVETDTQVDRLRALGCDLAQGWHLAHPVGADEVAALLRGRGVRLSGPPATRG